MAAFFLVLVFLLVALWTKVPLAGVALIVAVVAVFFPSGGGPVGGTQRGKAGAKKTPQRWEMYADWQLSLRGLLATGGLVVALGCVWAEHGSMLAWARMRAGYHLSVDELPPDRPTFHME